MPHHSIRDTGAICRLIPVSKQPVFDDFFGNPCRQAFLPVSPAVVQLLEYVSGENIK
jgi:hypothetical protein